MYRPLLKLRVNARLTAAFTTLILITIAVALSGLWALRSTEKSLDEIANQQMVKMQLATDMLNANAKMMATIQRMLLDPDVAGRSKYNERILEARKEYDIPRNKLFEMPSTEAAARVRDQITPLRDESRRLNQIVIDQALAGDTAAALASYEAGEAKTNAWQAVIRENIAVQRNEASAAYASASEAAGNGTLLVILGAAVAALVSVLLAFLITRSLTVPLRSATEAADRIARGVVDQRIVVDGRDETADLLRSMTTMQQRIDDLIKAQRVLTEQQMAGISSYRIAQSGFPGAFGELVGASNELANHNATVIGKILTTAASYSVGDLAVRMPQLPGEQAAVTEAMERTRENLSAVSSEISRLASAAAQGDFSHRGDPARFEHAYRTIINDLNQLFDTCDGSLAEISRLLNGIAQGDLTLEAKGKFGGVFGSILDAANLSADNLRRIIVGIKSSSQVISTSASEIATGNSDLSQRTEQQAANLEETAASMEELTSTVRQNAEHSRRASDMATAAEKQADEGGSAVREIVTTMESIATSSSRVSDIVTMIDSISFQTNILALNAAVEAARAGEQGRGFAVVASEVRVLAQRSAAAAKDVKTLIDGSSSEVARGVQLVDGAGKAMAQIVSSIKQVREVMIEIAAASQEQSAGIEQVNQTVIHMDEVTQQNAALVEEATAAARSMEDQARSLDDAVAVFKV